MPDLEKQEDFTSVAQIKKRPKDPLDARIPHKNIFVRCLYNIPQGTCMLALPGAVILMMGLIVLPWTHVEEGWSDGTKQAGIIFVAFGGVLFIAGMSYCCYYYKKASPQTPSKKTVTPHPPKEHVELVGVYRKREDGMSVPRDAFNNAPKRGDIATIS